jgi:hypothetical protein|tara:strand:+ start:4179 stop:7214 length:3036 start_codon:yes stop_codon:yes gene_type:complete
MINKRFFLFLTLAFIVSSLHSEKNGYWHQDVEYVMEITLLDSVQQLSGKTKVTYTNQSPDSLNEIFMHLYPNAFQIGSVKYREYLNNYGRSYRAKFFKDGLDGYESRIVIHSFSISQQKEDMLYEYHIDDTILKADLSRPLFPGDKIRIDIGWTHHVGDQIERAGYVDGQYNMAQWYPKMVVYDDQGWHSEPFHAEGEFYGEFGTFDVTLEVPERFIVGATGQVVSGDPGWSSVEVDTTIVFDEWIENFNENYVEPDSANWRKVRFHAEDVHDFAWIASTDFLYEHGSWNGIDVHVLYNKDNGQDWTREVTKRSIRALKWLTKNFGEYAYPQVTNTDRLKGGGMEYPMLIMDGSDRESLIVHEIGHIWFYGIVANNELDEAWLDEGFTSVQTRDYMMDRYGAHGFDLTSDDWVEPYQRKWPFTSSLHSAQWGTIRYITSGHDEPISRSSYLFKNGSSYRQNAYTKPSLMLNELRYILGDSLYYAGMQAYYSEWKLKHTNEERFLTSLENTTKLELDWFFDPWLHDTRIMDYGINSWEKYENEDGSWTVELELRNHGNRYMPLIIETEMEDGNIHRDWWKDHLWRFRDTLRYDLPSDPVRVTLDPDVQTVDVDYRNNTTEMKNSFIFDWPGLSYNPRNEFVYRWMPTLYYHELDGLTPGLRLDRTYGHWEWVRLRLNYATVSDPDSDNNIYWSIGGWRQPVHIFPRTKFHYWMFHQPGLQEIGFQAERSWSRVYGSPPYHTTKIGLYLQPEIDTTRTNVYDPGKLALLYLKHSVGLGSFDLGTEISSSVGPYSTWDFHRFTETVSFEWSGSLRTSKFWDDMLELTMMGVRSRFIFGKIWADNSGLPNQEGYNVEGNGSADMFRRSYLRDESSFFGLTEFNHHYHMPGEGNIRGFVGKGEPGADALTAFSTEIYVRPPALQKGYFDDHPLTLELALFGDGGIFWNGRDTRTLADAGLGFRLKGKLFEKDLFLRVDIPFLWVALYNYENEQDHNESNEEVKDYQSWLISFQRGI